MFKRRISWGAGHAQVFAAVAFAILTLTFVFTTTTLAQNNQNHGDSALAAKVRALNNQLLALHGQFQQGLSGNGAAAARNQAATVIAARAAALQSLIQQDPRAALSFAFSSTLLTDLAAKFPGGSVQLESHTTLSGPLSHWVEDYPDLKTARESWHMTTPAGTVDLYFGTQPPATSGAPVTVTITGVQVSSSITVSKVTITPAGSASTPVARNISFENLQPYASFLFMSLFLVMGMLWMSLTHRRPTFKQFAACAIALIVLVSCPSSAFAQTTTCSTLGPQNVAVLLVNFPTVTPPSSVTAQSIYHLFFGTTDPSLTGYWTQASYGQTSATGNVFGWYTLAGTYGCSNISQFISDAMSAAAASGVNFETYNRVFIVFPGMSPSCGWAGLSSIGCTSITTASGTYSVSTSVLVWGYLSSASQGVSVISHEGGHQLGLAHARLRTFTDSNGNAIPLGPLGTTGTLYEYGDHFSEMGLTNLGHYAAGHKAEWLDWISNGANYQVVQSSGTYTLQPYESNPAGLDALKIQRGTGNDAWLWVEYRQSLGNYDGTLYPAQVFSGALIHYEDSVTSFQTDLLDFTAPSTYSDDPALVAGQSWTDPYTNLSLSVVSATSNGLTITVNYGATTPCTSAAPTVSVSPLNPSIYPGQTASYSVAVTDNDSSGCSSSTINLASSEPAGWSTSLSSPSVTLSPGQSASISMGKVAPSGTAAGTYAVDLTASNTSTSGSGTANATVMTAPTLAVNVSVSPSSVTPPATVGITATVTNGGTPVAGASVTFTLKGPNGSTTTQTATTATNGIATWNYKLNAKAAPGTYSASAQASLNSGGSGGKKNSTSTNTSTQTATSNAASFMVQ